jgi:hypothetical protein
MSTIVVLRHAPSKYSATYRVNGDPSVSLFHPRYAA